MQINVNVSEVNLTDEIDGRGPWDEETETYAPMTLADLVAEKLADRLVKDNNEYYNDVYKRVSKQMDEYVRERVAPLVDEAMLKPIRKTNSYGEPTGQETTMTELILASVKAFLEHSQKDGYGRGNRTKAQQLVDEAVGNKLTKELSEVVAAERTKVVEAVRAQAGKIIAEAVTKGVGGK